MTEAEAKEYMQFMSDPANSHNCGNCPENRNYDNWQGKLPCGQQHCWVDQHSYVQKERS